MNLDDFINTKNPDYNMCLKAVSLFKDALHYINVDKFSNDRNVLKITKTPALDLYYYAVSCHGEALRYVRNPTDKIIRAALFADGNAIRFCFEQKDDYCTIAINSSPNAIHLIRRPTEDLCKLTISIWGKSATIPEKFAYLWCES
jgi:hypothetical protein